MPTKTPLSISTIADLGQNDMTLALYYPSCKRWAEIIPAEWLKTHLEFLALAAACSGPDVVARGCTV